MNYRVLGRGLSKLDDFVPDRTVPLFVPYLLTRRRGGGPIVHHLLQFNEVYMGEKLYEDLQE